MKDKKHPMNHLFWYCYSNDVFEYLHEEKKITYITKARHIETGHFFAQFFRTEVEDALTELKKNKTKILKR